MACGKWKEGKGYSVKIERPCAERNWLSEEVISSDLKYKKEPAVQKPEAQRPEHSRWTM